jgi:hypothetical protein
MTGYDTVKALVMRCMLMRFNERESLEYVREQGYQLSRAEYYRIKKRIQDSKFDRLNQIAKGFVDHHLERLDTLELINHEMWTSYRKGDYKAMDALSNIAEIQPIVSNYFDASKTVMEDEIDRKRKEIRNNNESKTVESASWD